MQHLSKFRLVLTLTVLVLFICNIYSWRLLTGAQSATSYSQIREESVLNRLKKLRTKIENGAGEEMQKLFPEGEFFSYALYGYTWVNIGLQSTNSKHAEDAITQITWALSNLERDEVKSIFYDVRMSLDYGIFYYGWYNRLLAGLANVYTKHGLAPDSQLISKLQINSDKIAEALGDNGPFLEAYPRQIWPCDTFSAISSLALADAYLDGDYKANVIDPWIADAKNYLQVNQMKLFPHTVALPKLEPIEKQRATSSSYILIFLRDIDANWANEYYQEYKNNFLGNFFSFTLLREYPHGIAGEADVDTGPLVFGYAATPTVVTAGLARIFADFPVYDKLVTLQNIAYPAASRLLIFELFNVWGETATTWQLESINANSQPSNAPGWKIRLQAAVTSLSLALVAAMGVYDLRRKWHP